MRGRKNSAREFSRSPCAAGRRGPWVQVAGPVQGGAAFDRFLVGECRAQLGDISTSSFPAGPTVSASPGGLITVRRGEHAVSSTAPGSHRPTNHRDALLRMRKIMHRRRRRAAAHPQVEAQSLPPLLAALSPQVTRIPMFGASIVSPGRIGSILLFLFSAGTVAPGTATSSSASDHHPLRSDVCRRDVELVHPRAPRPWVLDSDALPRAPRPRSGVPSADQDSRLERGVSRRPERQAVISQRRGTYRKHLRPQGKDYMDLGKLSSSSQRRSRIHSIAKAQPNTVQRTPQSSAYIIAGSSPTVLPDLRRSATTTPTMPRRKSSRLTQFRQSAATAAFRAGATESATARSSASRPES